MGKYDIPKRDKQLIGAPPGTLAAKSDASETVLSLISFDEKDLIEQTSCDPALIKQELDSGRRVWVNVDGLKNVELIEKVGEILGIHKLALEDVVKAAQRPKVEDYKDNLFIVVKMISFNTDIQMEQVGIFLGKNYIATFHEHPCGCLDPVRERLRTASGRIRMNDISYLAYAIIDYIIDAYYPALEIFGESLEDLEDIIIERPNSSHVTEIHNYKRKLLSLRRAIWPLREAINSLIRDPSDFVSDYTNIYFRDCYDHLIQIIDIVENFREVTSDLMSIYLSSLSNKMNEIMKVLTIIATIFMPLSFLASLWGMNYDMADSPLNMPELHWYFGYPFALTIMISVALTMVAYFRRRGWIGN